MARDSKKNAAYDSGIRGAERAKTSASAPRGKNKEDVAEFIGSALKVKD